MGDKIRVFIVEKFELLRIGLQYLIEGASDMAVVGQAADASEALALICQASPHVIIVGGLPDEESNHIARTLKAEFENLKVIVLARETDDFHIPSILETGADGYCINDASSNMLLMAVRAVSVGGSWLHPAIAEAVRAGCARVSGEALPRRPEPKLAGLSPRESEVLLAMYEGLNNPQIASKLALKLETVKTHVRHIYEKLSVCDRTEALVKAVREGLIT